MGSDKQHIVTLLIPSGLASQIVPRYSERGSRINKDTIELRKESQARKIAKLEHAIEVCKDDKVRAILNNALNEVKHANTWKGNRTNEDKKLIAMFIAMKAITPTSCIHSYQQKQQRDTLEQYTKKNFKTIQAYIKKLEVEGLATVTGNKYSRNKRLNLASWQTLCDKYDLVYNKQFSTFKYDLNNPYQTPDYIIDGVEMAEEKEYYNFRITQKIRNNHRVTEWLKNTYGITVINKKTVEQIESFRHSWFVNGFPTGTFALGSDTEYSVNFLYSLNTCTDRTRLKLKSVRNQLKQRNITYLKHALSNRSICNITNIVLKSNVKNRVPNRDLQANGFNVSTKQTTWFIPSIISIPNCTVNATLQP